MGRFVIVAYTPKPGRELSLLAAVKKHCDYTPRARLPEAQQMFAEFEAVPI